jgi:hypothetical protein
MSTATPHFAIVQISESAIQLDPKVGSEAAHPDYTLALIAVEGTEWSLPTLLQSAKVMVTESSLPAAVKAFQARCVADLSLDPVDMPLLDNRGDQIGTGRDLGFHPYDPK